MNEALDMNQLPRLAPTSGKATRTLLRRKRKRKKKKKRHKKKTMMIMNKKKIKYIFAYMSRRLNTYLHICL
jgi:gas vesicle protein